MTVTVHHCRICVTDFRDEGNFCHPHPWGAPNRSFLNRLNVHPFSSSECFTYLGSNTDLEHISITAVLFQYLGIKFLFSLKKILQPWLPRNSSLSINTLQAQPPSPTPPPTNLQALTYLMMSLIFKIFYGILFFTLH